MADFGGYGAIDGSAALSGGQTGGRDLIDISNTITQTGDLESFDIYLTNATPATHYFKLKVWRLNGANYDFIGESQQFTGSAGANTGLTLTTPIEVQTGDYIGIYLSYSANNKVDADADVGSDVVYQGGDSTTNQATSGFTTVSDFSLCAEVDGTVASSGTITLTEPTDNSIVQRTVSSGDASVTISGTYTGTPTAVQARIVQDGTSTEVHTWSTIDASPSGNAFSGSMTVDEGGWYNIQVRFSNDTGITDNGANAFGVGMLVGVIGQSNAENWFTDGTDETPNTKVVKYDGSWALMTSTGNGANAFGDVLQTSESVPIGLLDYGVGGSGLASGVGTSDWTSATAGQPYPLFDAAVTAVGGKLEYLLWVQGEQDSYESETEADYESALSTFISKCRTDITNGSNETNLPFIISLLGRTTNGTTDANQQAVRNAQIDTADTVADCYRVTTVDLALGDAVHFSNAAYRTHGDRCAQAILDIIGNQTYHRGPQITSATKVSSTVIDVTISHTGSTDFTPTTGITGFEVTDDDWSTNKTISSAVRQDATTIRLTLSSAISGAAKVRYMYGANPTITGAVVGNAALSLPLEHERELTATGATYEAGLSLGATLSATPTVNAILEASASFAASQSVSSDNIATLSVSLSFGGSLGYSTDGAIATGPQTIEAALSIGVVQSLDSISIANLYAATTVGSSLAVSVAGGSAIEAAISYALTQSTAQTADISIEGALAFGVNQSLQNQAQADLTASATLAHQVSLQLIAGAVLNAGLSLANIQSVSTNGFNLIVGIVTPDGRTITIRAEDRTITIQ